MVTVLKSIQIDAPREHVFALATDITRQPEWTTFVKEAVITGGDGKSAGTTDRETIKVGPRARQNDGVWTEYRPAEVFARKATGGLEMQERMSFEPSGNGTKVEWRVDYTPPMGFLGAVLNVVIMDRVFQNEIEASLEKLKSELEV